MDHPQRILRNDSFNCIYNASTFLKVREFFSLHKIHINHNWAKFHNQMIISKPIPPQLAQYIANLKLILY